MVEEAGIQELICEHVAVYMCVSVLVRGKRDHDKNYLTAGHVGTFELTDLLKHLALDMGQWR